MGYITSGKDGDIFISDSGVKYDLLEGVTMGCVDGEKTSDIVFLMFTIYDCGFSDCVGFSFGATFYRDSEWVEWMDKTTKAWEEKHRDIVDGIKNGSIKEF